jgi:Phospholipid methyltransferase
VPIQNKNQTMRTAERLEKKGGGRALPDSPLRKSEVSRRLQKESARDGHPAQGQEVITTGPYALVRHPMYVGVPIMVVGFRWRSAPGGAC